eukprot:CAMPEP_0201572140 /NCGR_PEP_ID=MMETSP0190_2-20130828/15249_1 /ASSEMBLY_ACC=CAM_ASM_000263 /TAXON_ID=37353 /ORGANISM="Rosalina sp." /LENGTH=103 /DNA_ID=CAMNT_0047997535 /DNA_START=119 /DNA_END=430 /DNA_ORIENTATION=+
MAYGGGKDNGVPKKHDYKMHFEMEPNDKTITIEIEDKVEQKKWKVMYNDKDYNDIESEFKKIQECINDGETEIVHPEKDGMALVLNATKGYNSYRFELAQSYN